MLRKLIGWLANFYPNTVFYSTEFMDDVFQPFTGGEDTDVHSTGSRTCMLGVAIAASRTLEPEGYLHTEFTTVTDKGRDVGDYEITVKRLR